MSLDEIAECLALPKTTVWYWIEDLPDPEIKNRLTPGRRRALAAAKRTNQARFKAKRDAAYAQGSDEFDALAIEPGFRDFVCMYIGEGYKRNRNRVSIGNSDPAVVLLSASWIRRLSTRPLSYGLQYHADQDPEELIRFWATLLGEPRDRFRLQRKSNSGQLKGRNWRSRYGVLTVTVYDTYLRSRMQGWIDRVERSWLDSVLPRGVAQPGSAFDLGSKGPRFKSGRPD
jgi:hypothetical protein